LSGGVALLAYPQPEDARRRQAGFPQ